MKRLAEPFLEVQCEFDFGACDAGAMGFKERQLTHMANNDIGMEHDKHELHQIEVAKSDKLKPESLLSTKKKRHVIVVVLEAFIRWLVDHRCPHLSFDFSELRSPQNDATIQDMLKIEQKVTICQTD